MKPLEDIDFGLDELPGQELHDVLAEFRARGDLVPTRLYGMPAKIIAGHAALSAAFRDDTRFPGHRTYEAGIEGIIGRTFISMEGRDHLAFRKLAMPAFRSRAVETWEREGLAALAHELIDRFSGNRKADLVGEFAARFPYLVITRVLGLPRDREDEFHELALAMLRFGEDRARAERAQRELTAILEPVVEARRREPRNDVISELVQATTDDRQLTDDEVHSHIRLLFPTGGETTHGTLGNLLYALLVHDGQWDEIAQNRSCIPAAVEEALRWESSIAVLPRMSGSRDAEFRGTALPADTIVLFAIAGANRDPSAFENPDHFDMHRQTERALTFGPGVKSCPGMHLARKNLCVALEALAERLPRLHLLDQANATPRRTVLRSPDALRVEIP